MKYTISHIATILEATIIQHVSEIEIEYLLIDSRRLLFPASTLFFALPGHNREGIDYIDELYQKGVRCFVVRDDYDKKNIEKYPLANFIQVENVLFGLQRLAAFHRSKFEYPVIGITGSNGKTIIKEWLYQLLQNNYRIVRSPKSYNSQIGVALSVWQMKSMHELALIEAGVSQRGEMGRLEEIIKPTIGVLGFMGEAHAEGFESMEDKINQKLELFTHSKQLVYCSDNPIVKNAITQFKSTKNSNIELIAWGKSAEADLIIQNISASTNATTINCRYKEQSFEFSIPFTDEASIYNALTCCAVLCVLKIELHTIIALMSQLSPLEMRLEFIKGNNECSVINDSYSADMDSLNIALDFLSQQELHQTKTVILSDMLESGISEDKLYQQLSKVLQQKNIHRLIGIGPKMVAHQQEFNWVQKKSFYQDTVSFISAIKEESFSHEAILLKGARVFEFEKISQLLEQKTHDTVLEINLNALRSNLKSYRKLIEPSVKIMAMVKAFSYGSGTHEIANLLQQEGVEYLAVAYTDEGVELRKAGIHLPIMVMNTTEAAFENLVAFDLEPEIYSHTILHKLKTFLHSRGIIEFPIHIKLDTGMHRLGFMENDLPDLMDLLQGDKTFKVQTVFSHLAASENILEDAYTEQQSHLFNKICKNIEHTIGHSFIKHLANTAAIFRHPTMQYDMVRLGIGLYGVDSNIQLENVTTLKTTIAQIKKLPKGATVGYGRKGMLEKDSIIATVRIGYADGYSRIFSNGIGKMLVFNQLAPVIGNVCMDMTMLDITNIDAKEGDEVIVFGKDLSVNQVSVWANTIPYEILTNISQRVKRIYYEE